MTDTRGDSGLDTTSVVPLTIDAASGPGGTSSPAKGWRRRRSLGSDAWRDLRRRPMFWISLALIVFFVVMAIFPQLFTSKDPNFADLSKARQTPSAEAWFGYDARATTSTPEPSTAPEPRSSSAFFATVFSLVFGSCVGIIAGYRGGWLDSVIGRIGEIFLGIPLLLGGILFLYTFPNPLDTPFVGRRRRRSPSSSPSSPGQRSPG